MAATFVVETGAGVAGANSYATEAEALQYHENAGTAAANWSSLTSTVKQQRLRNGTRYLDRVFAYAWKGNRANETQPLAWPRSGVTDDDGYAVDSDAVPEKVKRAVSRAAELGVTDTTMLPVLTDPGSLKRKAIKIGTIAIDKTYTDGKDPNTVYQIVTAELSGLICNRHEVVRG